jgi:carotenoid phi-ring synthase / carotenoid chi-ring synthase
MPRDNSDHPVIIIGGGVAGLTAALHLAERGVKPVVLEADDFFLGGRLAGGESISVGEYQFRLEHGVHGIWSQYRNFQAMLARNNLRPVIVPAQEENWIYKHGQSLSITPVGSQIRRSVFPPPFHYLQLFFRPQFLWALDVRDWFSLFNVWAGLIMAVGVDPYGEEQPLTGETLSDLTRRWSPALKGFFLGLARNGLSANPVEVPLSGFLGFLRFYTIMRRDAWVFSYLPEDGGTSVCEPLGDQIRSLGGEIERGCRVTKLVLEEGEYRVNWQSSQGLRSALAQNVILATDAPNTQKILQNSFRDQVSDLSFPRGLENAVVRLWFDTTPLRIAEAGIFSGDFILHNYFWLDRMYNPYRRWARETGGCALEAHIYGPPEVLAQPDGAILAQALRDVYQTWPDLRGRVIQQHLQRNPDSHTLPEVGPQDRHLGVVTPWKNLFCAGDWVRDPSPAFFLERASVMGIKAANQILAARDLQTWPLLEYLPPEPFVGWIEKLMRCGRHRKRASRNIP